MEFSAVFAREFARLVHALIHRPKAKAEQKAALRAAMAALKRQDVRLTSQELNLVLQTSDEGDGQIRLHELITRLAGHSVRSLDLPASAPPAHVLELARLIAREPKRGDEGQAFYDALRAIEAPEIVAHLGASGFARAATPQEHARYVAPPAYGARTPTHGATLIPTVGTPAFGTPAVREMPPALDGAGGTAVLSLGPDAEPAAVTAPVARHIDDESQALVEAAIATPPIPTLNDEELITQLRSGLAPAHAVRVLDQMVHLAESRALQHNWPVMARLFVAIVREEARHADDSELRRSFGLAIRRLTKPTFLRELARMLPRHPDQREGLQQVLLRTGEEGAEALIDLLTNADLMTDRRAYLAALAQCRAAVPTLMHLLGDKRWYVVRNAADLLGEMQAGEAEAKLAELVRHPEERVRRAVGIALTRIGSPRALHFAIATLGDSSAEVRAHVASALGATRQARAVQGILKALDDEQDGEAQATMLAALGRAATPESVERLVRTAKEDGGIFRRRKLSAQRVAAVLALGEAATPAAFAAVEALAEDRDRDVRETAHRVLAQRGRPRRPTPVG